MKIIKALIGMFTDSKKQNDYSYCRRCGRKLKSEQSKKLGLGLCCYKKEVNNKTKSLF